MRECENSLSDNCSEEKHEIAIRDFGNIRKLNEYPVILIADDNDFNRMILGSLLSQHNIPYSEACTGREAYNMVINMSVKMKPFKLVIMDGNMPDLNGWEATRLIHENYRKGKLDNLPVIIGYTAYSSEADMSMFFESGMRECLIKPCSPDVIIRTIQKYLSLN